MSFYETYAYEKLYNPEILKEVLDNWTETIVPVKNQEQTKYLWFAEVHDETTTIYANFHDYNPNEELVETNVRKHVFYPEKTNMNYIPATALEPCHADTEWVHTTADQSSVIEP